jgi:hypothetical protein
VDWTEHGPEPNPTPPPEDPSTPPPVDPRLEVALGLLSPYHRDRLKGALHFYLWLLSRRRPFYSPWVGGVDPVTARPMVHPVDLLAAIHAVDTRTLRRWIRLCRTGGYIRTETVNTGDRLTSGLRIRILKAKYWRHGRMVVAPDQDHRPIPSRGQIVAGGVGQKVVEGAPQVVVDKEAKSALPQDSKTLHRERTVPKDSSPRRAARKKPAQGARKAKACTSPGP